eukprot:4586515-Pyramimonas_sp.AAC.1
MPPKRVPDPNFYQRLRPVTRRRFRKMFRDLIVTGYRCRFFAGRVKPLRIALRLVERTAHVAIAIDDLQDAAHTSYARQ